MKLMSKKILILVLLAITVASSIVAICLAVYLPDKVLDNTSQKREETCIENNFEDIQCLTDQDRFVAFQIHSNEKISCNNIDNFVSVTEANGNAVPVSYSDGYICAPSGGYEPGGAYTITLKTGVKFADARFSDRQDLVFLIHREETFEAKLSENTNELPETQYVSYNGTDKLVLTTNKYKAGDIIKFERTDYYNQPVAVKVVSSRTVSGGTEYTVETPYLEEVFDELDVSQHYDIQQEDFEIDQEGIDSLINELENAPLLSGLAYGALKFLPEIKLEISPTQGGLDLHLQLRFNISGMLTSDNKAVAKQLVRIIKQSTGSLVDKSLNVYFVFKLDIKNTFDVYQNLDLSSGNFTTITTKSTTTKYGFYLEVEGGIISIFDDVDGMKVGKDEYEDLQELFDQFEDYFNIKKEFRIARLYASYMRVIGVGIDVNFVFCLGFRGQIGIENTVTTVQQQGMINTPSGQIPIENKSTQYSNWGLSAYGIARAETGINVDFYVDALVIFKAGVKVEAGIYAEIGGAFALEWGDGYVLHPASSGEATSFDQHVYTALYFEAGVYFRASFYAEVNMFIAKFKVDYTFFEVDAKFFEIGNKVCRTFIIADSNKTLIMENGSVALPEIYIQEYNIFEGTKTIKSVDAQDITFNYDNSVLTRDADGLFWDISGEVDVEHVVGVGLLDHKFANYGTGIDLKWFSNSTIEQRDTEAFVADSIGIMLIKQPTDIEAFDLSTVGDKYTVEIGSELVLTPVNIQPINSTFSEIECKLKYPVDGVSLEDNVLKVSQDAVPEQKIILQAQTKRNKGEQVQSSDLEITIKDVPLNSISIFPYKSADMSEFNGGTIIPVGADIKLELIKYPENAKYTNLVYEVRDGEQYLKNAHTDKVISENGELSIIDDIPENCNVAIVARATNTNGEEIVSRPLVLNIKNKAINKVTIKADSNIVHQGESVRLGASVMPKTAVVDSVEYAIISGQFVAEIDKTSGVLTIRDDAPIGGVIEVIAIADGIESAPAIFTVSEYFAEKIIVTNDNGTFSSVMYYGQTLKLNVNIYPANTTYKDYEYEVLSGQDNIYIDSFADTITLKYNFDPAVPIKFRVKKTLNDGKDTVMYSDVYTIDVETVAIDDFYIFPKIENILPGEEYRFDFSFVENGMDKTTLDYIIGWKYELIEGAEYASIDNSGVLVVDKNVARHNYIVTVRCTLTTINGVYTKDVILYCKMAAENITVNAETDEIMTSDNLQLNVEIMPRSAYIKSVQYQIVQGSSYGSIDENGLLIVYDALNVGKQISVRAIVTSISINATTGEEEEVVSYSSPYVLTIIEKPVESVGFDFTVDKLRQGESAQFAASVYPANATYKNVEFSLIDSNNCATISTDGTITVNQRAKVGSVVTVVATSVSNRNIIAQHDVAILKASLLSFDATYVQDDSNILVAPNQVLTLTTYNPVPSYYVFDDGEVTYSVIQGNATINGNKLTVGQNASTDTPIKVRAEASGVYSEFSVYITVVKWTNCPTELERGSDVLILAEAYGNRGGYNIEYYFADTYSHTNRYGEITNVNNVYIYDHVSSGTAVEFVAKLGNIEIKYTATVKKIVSINLVLTDSNNNTIDGIYESGVLTTALLHPNYKLDNRPDNIQISVNAYLSNGKIANSASYSVSCSADQNANYLNVNANTISLTSNSYSGKYATVKVRVEDLETTLRIYAFVPAGSYLGQTSQDAFILRDGLSNGASMLFVPSGLESDTTFKKGDTYDFGKYFLPVNYSDKAETNPTNLTYSASSGTISANGLWTAAANEVGGKSFNVTLKSANTYKGRTFGADLSRTCTFKMPKYIYNQSGLASINGSSDEFYLRNDITLSGTWTPLSSFSGTFDGGWHTLSGFQYIVENASKQFNLGFVGDNYGSILCLNIGDISISYTKYGFAMVSFGSIAVKNYKTIKYCTTKQQEISLYNTDSAGGGIVYQNEVNAVIESCNNNISLAMDMFVGGICGNNLGSVKKCTNNGVISSKSTEYGNIVGKGNAAI